MSKPFDSSKPVMTRDGRKARIICTDSLGQYPIIALVLNSGDEEQAASFTKEGRYQTWKCDSGADLINIPEEPKWRAWKASEFPLNAVLKHGPSGIPTNWIDIADRGVVLGLNAAAMHYHPFQELFENWLHTVDAGVTWNRCGILEA